MPWWAMGSVNERGRRHEGERLNNNNLTVSGPKKRMTGVGMRVAGGRRRQEEEEEEDGENERLPQRNAVVERKDGRQEKKKVGAGFPLLIGPEARTRAAGGFVAPAGRSSGQGAADQIACIYNPSPAAQNPRDCCCERPSTFQRPRQQPPPRCLPYYFVSRPPFPAVPVSQRTGVRAAGLAVSVASFRHRF